MNTKSQAHKSAQKAYYQGLAGSFDKKCFRLNRNHFNKIKAIQAHLKCAEGEMVLEIGTGTGIHAEFFQKENPGATLIGLDMSFSMLKECEQRAGKGNLICGDGEGLPFRSEIFDAVYISGSLHHLSDCAQGLREIIRVVRQGGKFAIMEPQWIFPTNFIPSLFNPHEKNIRWIRKKNFRHFFRDYPEIEFQIGHLGYTPPFPRAWYPFYEKLESILKWIPVLRSFSIMLFVFGVKKK